MAPEVADRLAMLGTTANGAALLDTPPTVTTIIPLPPVAALGTGTIIEVVLQFVDEAVVPLKVTALVPCGLPKPVPAIVTSMPATPDDADRLAMFGITVNETPLLALPPTVTATLPVVAPFGTETVIAPDAQLVGVAAVPLKAMVLPPWVVPKPVPEIVIEEPIDPEVADRPVIFGTTVNVAPLLAVPLTVTMTEAVPAVAPAGTGAAIDVALQVVGTVDVPLKVTTLLP